MIVVNLIPADRQLRRRRRLRIRGWTALIACYTVFLVVAFIASAVVDPGGDDDITRRLSQARTNLASGKVTMTALQNDIDEATARLVANREVGDQPDWSIVLALLAEATGDEIVLSRCRLYSASAHATPHDERNRTRAGNDDADAPVATIEISGLARSQQDVSNLLLRMEGMPLFRDVRLNDTRREPFLTGSVIAFRADFVISLAGGSSP